ncbi:MAG TPA: EamA family transporter [Flavobacteriaceae bacterium]|jgi:drug/metabolite transporter (DMT)-like permease|nr:EamA family transporter [Flavobacteriaceae bacterium]
MNSRNIALVLAFLAALIYGVTYTIAKDIMPLYVKPYAFIILRVLGATVLFWITGLFVTKERIEKSDYFRIFLAAIFGVVINMLAFFKGLSLTTPISASVMMLTSPILILILSAIILKEKVTTIKVLGIVMGLAGAVILIIYGQSFESSPNAALGNFLIFINATSYSLYIIIVKRLTDKYNPLTFIKWMYLIGLFLVIPFGYSELQEIQWQVIPTTIFYKIGFVVVFTTFFAYLFNIFALTKLKPTTLSSFIYLQPVLASLYALFTGSDTINTTKIIATLFIFAGVYIVTISNKPK